MTRGIVAAEPHLEDDPAPRDRHRYHVRQRVSQEQEGSELDHGNDRGEGFVAAKRSST